MRESNAKARNIELPNTYTDNELMETLGKMIAKGWVLNYGHGIYNLIGPGSTKSGETLQDLLNPIHKEKMEAFL